ncbi:hypothetical protein DXG01_008308 [Tephrocybe rancida]|nr:hypothetical protein DXG01_008308 [Tephrocybe rancida]
MSSAIWTYEPDFLDLELLEKQCFVCTHIDHRVQIEGLNKLSLGPFKKFLPGPRTFQYTDYVDIWGDLRLIFCHSCRSLYWLEQPEESDAELDSMDEEVNPDDAEVIYQHGGAQNQDKRQGEEISVEDREWGEQYAIEIRNPTYVPIRKIRLELSSIVFHLNSHQQTWFMGRPRLFSDDERKERKKILSRAYYEHNQKDCREKRRLAAAKWRRARKLAACAPKCISDGAEGKANSEAELVPEMSMLHVGTDSPSYGSRASQAILQRPQFLALNLRQTLFGGKRKMIPTVLEDDAILPPQFYGRGHAQVVNAPRDEANSPLPPSSPLSPSPSPSPPPLPSPEGSQDHDNQLTDEEGFVSWLDWPESQVTYSRGGRR